MYRACDCHIGADREWEVWGNWKIERRAIIAANILWKRKRVIAHCRYTMQWLAAAEGYRLCCHAVIVAYSLSVISKQFK